MKEILYRLFEHQYLNKNEAKTILMNMAEGKYNESQIAAFITVYFMRSISVEELLGFREALLEMRVKVDELSVYNPIDIVGTGGDNKNTFNISTTACFVVAGAGYKVAKHGNYGATSVSGASNVMEEQGVKFSKDIDLLKRSMEATNIAYLHAPFFNLALKTVAPVRRALAVRTFFNMLGPIVNPLIPRRQLLGVYDLKMARLYHYIYQQSDCDFTVVHSLDGYDEISLTSKFKVINKNEETIFSPEDLGFPVNKGDDLNGGTTVAQAAEIFRNVIENKATDAQTNTVLANAAFAIRIFEPNFSIADCLAIAKESIQSGKAKRTLEKFVEINS
ncbi:MAG: anthranilate phosphoribosyltransferase [Prevotellaceae bacterium]|jgi:anthranilate phosphoribosyltransferase|nr:anthranilate phosphoribosyltransferase [Prevotellaceae bacterium]